MRTLHIAFPGKRLPLKAGLLTLACTLVQAPLQAASTDISQSPLVTASGTPVKPNLMFILDDSGSMNLDFLPEEAGMGSGKYSELTAQCNGLAYDPDASVSYPAPVNADGTSETNAATDTVLKASNFVSSQRVLSAGSLAIQSSGSITISPQGGTAKSSWYSTGGLVTIYSSTSPTTWMLGTVSSWNASTRTLVVTVTGASTTGTLDSAYVGNNQPPVVYYKYSGTEPKLGYTFTSGVVDSGTNFYKQCASAFGANPGAAVFTRVVVTSASADLQKYSNWYAFYSTRMRMMKTVVSMAFKDIDDKFRVGFTTILNKSAQETVNDPGFLHVRDFDGAQRVRFYDSLKGSTPSGYTPLRGALTKTGQYFALKAPGQLAEDPVSHEKVDPMQFSCQKNFAILATDGAWNTNNESTTAPKYGPYKLDNSSAVGQQDGTADRPMKDNNSTSSDGLGTLADVAMYYYSTDLRTSALGNCTGSKGVDVCENNVIPMGKDTATSQHMTTYTMSLGQSGTLKYDPNYEQQVAGDFFNLKQGTKQWPSPSNDATKVDDLWHAAVNGRGTFFNAKDPAMVSVGLKNALATIAQISATGSAAATSTLRPVEGDNQVFIARFTSALWTGDLRSYRMDSSGNPLIRDQAGNDLADWSAAAKLKANVNRKIYYAKADKTLREFTYANLNADGMAGDFDGQCVKLSQCAVLPAAEKTAANSGANLVSYLRGTEYATYFRGRDGVLGDIVGSGPLYVPGPKGSKTDAGYDAFVTANKNRRPMVYVGANDGMLHAFDGGTGEEVWAFVPSAVRSQMYKLADMSYTSNHQYFVDGSPTAADVYVGGSWRTVMVFGLGAGGKSYVAMDVTNPNAPVLLWEFTNTNLGNTFARPNFVKRTDDSWAVVMPSGYNNVGDGKGRMFALNILTGQVLSEIVTTAGDPASPSGLGPLRAWIDSKTTGVALRYYAGDLLGNVWRFDLDGTLGAPNSVVKLAQVIRGGKPQPITTPPEVALVNQKGFTTAAVYVGTGRMIGLTDLGDANVQSIYGIKDNLSAISLGDVRPSLVEQGLTTNGQIRTATKNEVDWSIKNGWFIDLPDSGERINIAMQLSGSTLVAGSNVPQSVASCNTGGGYAWLYYIDVATGSNTGTDIGVKIPESMLVGLSKLGDGVLVTPATAETRKQKTPDKRWFLKRGNKTSWRELAG